MRTHHQNSPWEARNLTSGLVLISIGLADEKDLSQRALEEAKSCDVLYAELYTTFLNTDIQRLSTLLDKPVTLLPRSSYEESSVILLDEAIQHRVGVLIGGDCLSATTHISLLLDAHKRNIPTRIVHGSSILTAVAETGLSLYKFGRTVTLPLPEKGSADTVLKVLQENREQGLHTLMLLDLNTVTGKFLTISRAINLLLDSEEHKTFNEETLVVGIARLGWDNSLIRAGRAKDIVKQDFGDPPHALIVPGYLHFLETEALRIIGGSPQEALKNHEEQGELERLVEKYMASCQKALDELKMISLPRELTEEEVKALIKHVDRYLKDAEHYSKEQKAVALASISYAEGILDALKLLNLVEFEW